MIVISYHTSIHLEDFLIFFFFFDLDISFLWVKSLMKFDTLDGGSYLPSSTWPFAQMF